MGAQAAFVLGLLTGFIAYWIIYRIYWQHWRGYLLRDQAYLQEKIKSAEFTNLGLERQLAGQKGDLAALRSKINDLERENRQALAKLEEARKEKESMVTHLDALRVELAAYKKGATEPALPGLSMMPTNGKSHEPPPPTFLPERVIIPVNGSAEKKNGSAEKHIDAPKRTPMNGRAHHHLTPEPLSEPVLIIARPRMDGDRLEIIQGIGSTIMKKLRLSGIDTFLALSRLSSEQLREIIGTRAAKLIDAEKVIEQAKKLARERRA